MYILKHSNSQQCSICAITKNNTPLINNENINLKTTLINRKPLILVGISNRTFRKSPKLQKMKENNESLIKDSNFFYNCKKNCYIEKLKNDNKNFS